MFDELPRLNPDAPLSHAQWFDQIAQQLADRGELHRLFDLRLLQARHALGLPLGRRGSIDDVDEPLRTRLEEGYLDACREVGQLLLEADRFREAWMYLRPAGDKLFVRQRLERVVAAEESLDELIEVALFEGVDPERGYAWLLGKQGTCNAVTTLDSLQHQLAHADLQACAAVLLRHVYAELRGNLRGHLQKLKGIAPTDLSVRALCEQHPELLADGSYHLDASHLASSVRHARLLTERAQLGRALELVEYGARLPSDLQYHGEAPFEDTYPTHRLFFAALLGTGVEEAVEYFRGRAEKADFDEEGPGSVETLLVLLTRLQRPGEALEAYAQLVPTGRELSPLAPALFDLAEAAGAWQRYAELCRERDDVVGFAAGELAAAKGA